MKIYYIFIDMFNKLAKRVHMMRQPYTEYSEADTPT